MSLYLGCPIWAYKDWIGGFYPEGSKPRDFLREYARRLTTVEGNTTFYAVPAVATLQRWAADTPKSFRFCPKLPRTISHTGKLEEHIEQAFSFAERMSLLGERLGPMFLQLPPRYSPLLFDDLKLFLDAWSSDVPLAVEVRHIGWFDPSSDSALNEVLAGYDIARVVIDTHPIRNLKGDGILTGSVYQRLLEARERKPDVPILYTRTASFTFLRYIGHPQLEQNGPFIDEWAERIASWLREGATAYVFCHCPDERLDPWLCRQFHQRISESFTLPPLPWDGIARQERLF